MPSESRRFGLTGSAVGAIFSPKEETKLNWEIKRRLAEKKMLQRDLAASLDDSESYISRLVRGSIKDGQDIKEKVARELGSDVGEIF